MGPALLLVGLLVAGMVWLMRNGATRPDDDPPIVGAPSGWVRVATLASAEALVAEGLLEGHRIAVARESRRPVAHYGGSETTVRLYVAPEHAERATELLRAT